MMTCGNNPHEKTYEGKHCVGLPGSILAKHKEKHALIVIVL